MNLIKEKL